MKKNSLEKKLFFINIEIYVRMMTLLLVNFETTTKVDYGDETFRHNMYLFHHQIHMVMKQNSSPKLCHRMYW